MNLDWMSFLNWAAQQPTGGATGAAGNGGQANPFGSMMFLIPMILLLFYFMILRPQKAEQKKRENLLGSLTKGDRVLTSGGIYGTVDSVNATKNVVFVKVDQKVVIEVARTAVVAVTKKGKDGEKEEEISTEQKK